MYNDTELSLIKTVFAENEELIYAIRKVLLQFPLTEAETVMVKNAMTPEVYAILKKRIFPDVSEDAPLGQIGDIYQTLTNDLKSKNVEDMEPLLAAKQLEIDYLEQQFSVLKGEKTGEKIKLDAMKIIEGNSAFDAYVGNTARNFILGYIDPMLALIRSIAGQKEESVEEQKERMTRNSSK